MTDSVCRALDKSNPTMERPAWLFFKAAADLVYVESTGKSFYF